MPENLRPGRRLRENAASVQAARLLDVPLATLGDSLALYRTALAPQRVTLLELDASGKLHRAKDFAAERLGEAVIRLYERHAELVPTGPRRDRAAAIARSIAAATGPLDLDHLTQAAAPDIEYVDRRMFGMGPAHGAKAFVRGARIRLELGSGLEIRVDDVIELRPDALLARVTNIGTRAVGGAYRSPAYSIYMFDDDGRIARWELLDADARAAALARFDELTAALNRARRAVTPNAATDHASRLDDAFAAGQPGAISALIADGAAIVDHKTGKTLDREQWIASVRVLMDARNPEYTHEPLATLGGSVALIQRSLSASGIIGMADAGSFRIEEIDLIEADERGRLERAEQFALVQMDDAIVRLYERHAERLPAGPEQALAAAIARTVAVVLAPPEIESLRPVFALDVQYSDHRALGWGKVAGVLPLLRNLHTVFSAITGIEARTDRLLAVRADAVLVRRTVTALRTDGGGPVRRRPIVLWAFGAGGRITHWEHYDRDDLEAALARFDALARPAAPRRLAENAATRSLALSDRAEVLATRGDRIALARIRGEPGSESSLGDFLAIVEIDRNGAMLPRRRFERTELDAAHRELDARYAAGEAAEHPAMWAELSATRNALNAHDWDELVRLFSPHMIAEDHRPWGFGVVHSPQQYVQAVRSVTDLRPEIVLRIDHLAIGPRAALVVSMWSWSEAGESFGIPGVVLFVLGSDGRIAGAHHFSTEQIDAARARFAELCAERS